MACDYSGEGDAQLVARDRLHAQLPPARWRAALQRRLHPACAPCGGVAPMLPLFREPIDAPGSLSFLVTDKWDL